MKRRWTKEEDTILIKYYSKEGPDVIERLSGRTTNAIKNRAQQLGLIYRQEMFQWTEEELSILRQYYPIEGKRIIARLPGRTLKTIQVTAFRHNIKRRGN